MTVKVYLITYKKSFPPITEIFSADEQLYESEELAKLEAEAKMAKDDMLIEYAIAELKLPDTASFKVTERAKWILAHQYENAEATMYKLRKASLIELADELGLNMDQLIAKL